MFELGLEQLFTVDKEVRADLATQGSTCADHGLLYERGEEKEIPTDCPVRATGDYEHCPRFIALVSEVRISEVRLQGPEIE